MLRALRASPFGSPQKGDRRHCMASSNPLVCLSGVRIDAIRRPMRGYVVQIFLKGWLRDSKRRPNTLIIKASYVMRKILTPKVTPPLTSYRASLFDVHRGSWDCYVVAFYRYIVKIGSFASKATKQ